MKSLVRATGMWFCKLIKFFSLTGPTQNQTSMKEKAIVVAGEITATMDKGSSSVFCPVCLNPIQTQGDADLGMTLAVHLSLWHPDEVILQWDIMQKKIQPNVHLPSLIAGIGVAAAFGALLVISARNHTQHLTAKKRT